MALLPCKIEVKTFWFWTFGFLDIWLCIGLYIPSAACSGMMGIHRHVYDHCAFSAPPLDTCRFWLLYSCDKKHCPLCLFRRFFYPARPFCRRCGFSVFPGGRPRFLRAEAGGGPVRRGRLPGRDFLRASPRFPARRGRGFTGGALSFTNQSSSGQTTGIFSPSNFSMGSRWAT